MTDQTPELKTDAELRAETEAVTAKTTNTTAPVTDTAATTEPPKEPAAPLVTSTTVRRPQQAAATKRDQPDEELVQAIEQARGLNRRQLVVLRNAGDIPAVQSILPGGWGIKVSEHNTRRIVCRSL
jgi:hypothetical protein